ncbi:hypothetical protein WJX81_007427 [Elliptochloris bilobata]|uniref:thioredoxin-dependent peroxiredoxin n=1 Tax=Elliptochloris bilobata TaxID=381761 RepID=A0AAW1QCI7_9CHLO
MLVAKAFVGSKAPDFKTTAVVDEEITEVGLSDYPGKYVILFWYPKDFTYVCPSEIIAFSDRAREFEELNTQLIAASTDTPEVHLAWIRTPRSKGGLGHMQIPILADVTKELAAKYGVLLKDAGIALRGLFLINPEGVVEHITINNPSVGRSVDEAKRLLQAVQFVAEHGEVCPADWQPGGATMKADPEGSKAYFEAKGDHGDGNEGEFGTKLHGVADAEEFRQAVNGGQPLFVDFYAPWCGKCRQIAPFIEQLQEKHPDVKFIKVNIEADALKVISKEHVKVLPTFKFFKDGVEATDAVTGYKKKPIQDGIEKLLASSWAKG